MPRTSTTFQNGHEGRGGRPKVIGARPDGGARKAAKNVAGLEAAAKQFEAELSSLGRIAAMSNREAIAALAMLVRVEKFYLEHSRDPRPIIVRKPYQVIFSRRPKGYDPMLDPTHPVNQRRLQGRPATGQSLQALAPHHVKAPIPVLETPEGEPLEVVDD